MPKRLPKSVAIVGAGLAGAACANAFAFAGFEVVVFEQGSAAASGASGVPLAMFAPSVSSDDAPHSRLLRRGVHLLIDELHRLTALGLLLEGRDWALTGVLERCLRIPKKLPHTWLEPQDPSALQSRMTGKPDELWHGAAGWVNPKRLIEAWLAHPLVVVKTNTQVWDLAKLDADVVVVACGYQTANLVPALRGVLQPIRGQVEWGYGTGQGFPMNGMGHWIESHDRWLTGATFQREEMDLTTRHKDIDLNFSKLALLRSELAAQELVRLRAESQSWVGIRASQSNRVPLIERITDAAHPNTWVCAGLGSRGLSLAAQNARTLLQKVLSTSD